MFAGAGVYVPASRPRALSRLSQIARARNHHSIATVVTCIYPSPTVRNTRSSPLTVFPSLRLARASSGHQCCSGYGLILTTCSWSSTASRECTFVDFAGARAQMVHTSVIPRARKTGDFQGGSNPVWAFTPLRLMSARAYRQGCGSASDTRSSPAEGLGSS